MSEDLAREEQDHEVLSALAEAQAGPFRARAEARATREGLITFGVVASGVLLSAALLAWALRRPVR